MKKNWLVGVIGALALLGLLGIQAVSAQAESPFSISLRRDFGYGNGTSLQGRLSLHLKGDSAQVTRVEYLMDGKSMGVLTAEPFSLAFNTDDYPAGGHQFKARVETKYGKSYETAPISANFLTADQAQTDTKAILLPILGITAVAILISFGAQALMTRKSKTSAVYQKVVYGALGGAVCKRCGKPFSRSILGINIVVGKLERCPHCGKWQITTRASTQTLAEAEAELEKQYQPAPAAQVGAQETKDLLDDSRYTDKL